MKIVGVNGSGRADGNTAVLVNAVLHGAAESGAQTTLLQLADMAVAGCRACDACKEAHQCAIRDDMDRFYDIAAETDVLVLATPIYFDHVTAQLKAFLDRFYCYLGLASENYYPNKDARAVIGITYEAGGKHSYDCVLDWIAKRLQGYWRIKTIGSFAVHGTPHDSLIGTDHPVVRAAHDLGKSLV